MWGYYEIMADGTKAGAKAKAKAKAEAEAKGQRPRLEG